MTKHAEPVEPFSGYEHAPAPEPRAPRRQRRQPACEAPAGAAPGDAGVDERIIGSGDRMHHLALVAGRAPPAPPRPRSRLHGDADALVLPAGLSSRADCRRRCGKAGFCDPSSALGCGGEYCGNATAAAREAIFEPAGPAPGTAAPGTPPIAVDTDYL